MNRDRLIEALETALAELKQPTVTFTPPKREPLSERELYKAFIEELVQDNYGKWDIKSFVNGVRFAEKAHGIEE